VVIVSPGDRSVISRWLDLGRVYTPLIIEMNRIEDYSEWVKVKSPLLNISDPSAPQVIEAE
jgi:hypothetical protein